MSKNENHTESAKANIKAAMKQVDASELVSAKHSLKYAIECIEEILRKKFEEGKAKI